MQIIDYVSGANLGLGFNTATYDIHSPVFEDVSSIREVAGGGGQEVIYTADLISNTVSLTRQFNVSGKASLKYGVIGSGSLKTSFVNSFKENSFNVYVFVHTRVTNKQQMLDLSKLKFKNQAATLFSNDPRAFIQQYGDSFVYAVTTGGEFIGILEIESSSAEESKNIKASLSGKVGIGPFSAEAKGDLEKRLESITKEYRMKATILRQGGVGGILQQVTSDELVKGALQFPDNVRTAGYPYEALVLSYNQIEHPTASSPLDVEEKSRILDNLGHLREKFIKYQNDLTYALAHHNQFPRISITNVNARYKEIELQISTIVDAARSCYKDLTTCKAPESLNLALLDPILPTQSAAGGLIKGSGAATYIVQPIVQRRWIPDRFTFDCLGLKDNAVQELSDTDLEAIPRGPDLPSRINGTLLIGSGPAVYMTEGCQRRWITSQEAFNRLGLDRNAIQTISDVDLDAMPKGPDIS